MMVKITTTGGMAGIPGLGVDKEVDVDTLAPAVKEQVCEAFNRPRLEQLQQATQSTTSADRFNYVICVTEDSGATHQYRIDEDALPAETLDLIDNM